MLCLLWAYHPNTCITNAWKISQIFYIWFTCVQGGKLTQCCQHVQLQLLINHHHLVYPSHKIHRCQKSLICYLKKGILTSNKLNYFRSRIGFCCQLLPPATLQIKLGRALGKTPLNPIHIWVKHVLPKIFWA